MTRLLPLRVLLPLVFGLAVSLAVLVFAERSYRRLDEVNRLIAISLEVQTVLNELRALVADAETGQRGYLLTGDKRYLEPYTTAVPRIMDRFVRVRDFVVSTRGDEQRLRTAKLNNLIGKRIAELEATLALFERSGGKAALDLTKTDLGQSVMTELRATLDQMIEDERSQLYTQIARWDRNVTTARIGMQLMTGLTVLLLLIVWLLAYRHLASREKARESLLADQRRLESLVEQRTAELSDLATYLQTAREDEKRKLARDLHDELGAVLVTAKMDVSSVRSRVGALDTTAAGRLARALGTLDQAVDIKRRIIEELRPTLLDNIGLEAALDWLVGDVCGRAGIEWHLSSSGLEDPLPGEVSIAVFRIVQEALTNIVRHARARAVDVEIARTPAGVTLLVSDDGIGIPPERPGRLSHGIAGMRQRAWALRGEFSVRRRPEGGTVVEVRIPLAEGVHEAPGSAAVHPPPDAMPSSTSSTRS
ncbi:MAG: CHASE3 domain-containing protein [Burkholderiales bacterium]|nr:CHASE3 domain-containing protein [Burkholderiales bacterium]